MVVLFFSYDSIILEHIYVFYHIFRLFIGNRKPIVGEIQEAIFEEKSSGFFYTKKGGFDILIATKYKTSTTYKHYLSSVILPF